MIVKKCEKVWELESDESKQEITNGFSEFPCLNVITVVKSHEAKW